MTKKQNTLVFILLGTIFSIILALVLIIGFLALSIVIFQNNPDMFQLIFPITFIVALFLSMFIYQKLAQWVIIKFKMEDKLDPLFTRKHKKNIRD